jgi:hypothetical protein
VGKCNVHIALVLKYGTWTYGYREFHKLYPPITDNSSACPVEGRSEGEVYLHFKDQTVFREAYSVRTAQ